jgi:hypothetical protein
MQMRNKYKHDVANGYKESVNKKDDMKKAWKAEMLERGEVRVMQNDHERQALLNKIAAKREDQAKYRDVLDVQVRFVNSANGKRPEKPKQK